MFIDPCHAENAATRIVTLVDKLSHDQIVINGVRLDSAPINLSGPNSEAKYIG